MRWASADFEKLPGNGKTADFVRVVEGSAIDDGSRAFRNWCPIPGLASDGDVSVTLAGEAVGLSLQVTDYACWPITLEVLWPHASLIVSMGERGPAWLMGSHNRYQAEEENSNGHHRDRIPVGWSHRIRLGSPYSHLI